MVLNNNPWWILEIQLLQIEFRIDFEMSLLVSILVAFERLFLWNRISILNETEDCQFYDKYGPMQKFQWHSNVHTRQKNNNIIKYFIIPKLFSFSLVVGSPSKPGALPRGPPGPVNQWLQKYPTVIISARVSIRDTVLSTM